MAQFDAEVVARFENETWSRCAKSYMDGFGPLVGEAIDPLLEAVGLTEGDRVLDIGTGPGLAAKAAKQRGAEVIGIDFSKTMLAEARRLYPNIEFREVSADSLPFNDGDFDVVIGNFMLHHTGDPDQVLAEAYRVVRKNGKIGLTVWADPAKLVGFGLFFAAVEEHAGSAELPHGPLFGISDFTVFHRMLRKAGFRDSSVKELDLSWRLPSLDPYLAAFRDWGNWNAFPSDLRNSIESTVRARAAGYRTNGSYQLPNPAILLSAVK